MSSASAESQGQTGSTTVRTTPLLQTFKGYSPLPQIHEITASFADSPNLADIQGDILIGMRKLKETFIFFHINDADGFKQTLPSLIPLITSTAQLLGPGELQPLAFVNIAFSSTGLQALDITEDLGDISFGKGQFADAPTLKDITSLWESTFTQPDSIHGVFLVGSDDQVHIDCTISDLTTLFGTTISEVTRIVGSARPGPEAGHEHFGFLDGISNPLIQSLSSLRLPGQAVVPDGIILTGRDQDPTPRPSWTLDGSFLVFRKLKQLVPEFHAYASEHALKSAFDSVTNTHVELTPAQGADLLSARMIGRWKSGAPLDLAPLKDDPELGGDPARNNDFTYLHPGMDDKTDQSRCPFSAHVRKTRPRSDLELLGATPSPENTANQAIRAGIPYGEEVTEEEAESGTTFFERGLAFVEYQSSIANGFAFQQNKWANNTAFPPGKNPDTNGPVGLDPIIGQTGEASLQTRTVQGLDPTDFTASSTITPFVIPLGGEYFFSPSISAIATRFVAGGVQ